MLNLNIVLFIGIYVKYTDKYIRCPHCERVGEVVFESDVQDIRRAFCRSCDHKLKVYDGIPDFAGHMDLASPVAEPAQKLMNTRLFASLYESPIWRPLHTRMGTGISMNQEVRAVLEMSGKEKAHLVADLACGTGHYARALTGAFPGAAVYGLDISLSMLAQGRKVAKRNGLTDIMFLRGDIHLLPFENHSVDRVNCGGALHLFPELTAIWKEISRVLKPGGVFTAMTLTLAPGVIGKIQRWLIGRGKVTFFQPDQLAVDLSAVGFSSFRYQQHQVSLLFSVFKEPG